MKLWGGLRGITLLLHEVSMRVNVCGQSATEELGDDVKALGKVLPASSHEDVGASDVGDQGVVTPDVVLHVVGSLGKHRVEYKGAFWCFFVLIVVRIKEFNANNSKERKGEEGSNQRKIEKHYHHLNP